MSICIISEGARFEGSLRNLEGDIQVDGCVHGVIYSCGSVFVSKQGCIYSDIHAEQVIVSGKVLGDIYAEKTVRLLTSAIVTGNIYSAEIETESGCLINGKSKIFPPQEVELG